MCCQYPVVAVTIHSIHYPGKQANQWQCDFQAKLTAVKKQEGLWLCQGPMVLGATRYQISSRSGHCSTKMKQLAGKTQLCQNLALLQQCGKVWQSVASDDSDHAGLLHNIATAPTVMHNTTQLNTAQDTTLALTMPASVRLSHNNTIDPDKSSKFIHFIAQKQNEVHYQHLFDTFHV